MGCGISRQQKITVSSQKTINKNKITSLNMKSVKTKYQKQNWLNYINETNWKNIINFLSYSDLKEVGKTNKLFNQIAKNEEVLVKFFKKREKIYSEFQNSSLLTSQNSIKSENKSSKVSIRKEKDRNSQLLNKEKVVQNLQKLIKIPSFGDILLNYPQTNYTFKNIQ